MRPPRDSLWLGLPLGVRDFLKGFLFVAAIGVALLVIVLLLYGLAPS